uniref:Uncharacterized protein n=1 Tax=Rhizophora mucronata TaxID=61149 RepID=A0A2P2KEJ2_RHIMU
MACRLGIEVKPVYLISNFTWEFVFLNLTQCRLFYDFQVAIVIGGRNFFCGDTWVTATGSDRRTIYQIGYYFHRTILFAILSHQIMLE